MRVCQTMVVRPRCSGVHSARAVSPIGIGAKKLVLLSMVAVRPPSGRLAKVAVPPRLSASAMIAPPCMAPNRLLSSSRTKISASTLSLETCVTFIPIKLANGGCNSASRFMSWLIVRQRLRGSPRNCRAAAHRSQYASAGAGRAKSAAAAALLLLGRTFAALLRRRHDADVRFWRLPALRVKLLRFVVGDGAGKDDIFTLLPVRRRRDAVLGGELQRVD